MSTLHRTSMLPVVAVVAALTCAASFGFRHASASATMPAAAAASALGAASQDERERITIDFPGGSLEEFLIILQKEHNVQVVYEDDVLAVTLPPIQLKSVMPGEVFAVIGALRSEVLVRHLGSVHVVRVANVSRASGASGSPQSSVRPPRAGGGSTPPAPGRPAQPPAPPADRLAVFDLVFDGGTAREYVEQIRSANPQANIVVMPGADRASVPEVQLKSVTTELALQLLDNVDIPVDNGRAQITLRVLDTDHALEPLCIVRYHFLPDSLQPRTVRPRSDPTEIQSHVWSVAQPISLGVKADEMLSAIEAGLDMLEDEGRTSLRYHPDTQVLMLRGPRASLEFVDRMIDAITSSATTRDG